MIWQIKDRTIDLAEKGMIMGIINATPDSFSDGGTYLDPSAACSHGLRLEAEGADILDIGGESTRPGAESVPLEEELRRVIPVIRCIRATSRILISIDTSKAEVARAAIEAGADIINDVTALQCDPEMAGVASSTRAGVVLMHMQGTPRTMQLAPAYGDVIREVGDFFSTGDRSRRILGNQPHEYRTGSRYRFWQNGGAQPRDIEKSPCIFHLGTPPCYRGVEKVATRRYGRFAKNGGSFLARRGPDLLLPRAWRAHSACS